MASAPSAGTHTQATATTASASDGCVASPATVARNAAGGRIAAHVWGMRSAIRRGRRGRTTVSPWATASAVHDEMSTAPYPWKRAGIG